MPGLILSCMILLLHIPAAEDVPPNMGRDFLLKQIFLFNPFSIEIFKSVLENIIDSYYEAQRELLIILSLIHIPSPRDVEESRMPSSA